jgi:predicted DNA-binding protein
MSKKWGALHRFVGLRISPETYERLVAHAKEHGTTVSAFARGVLDKART